MTPITHELLIEKGWEYEAISGLYKWRFSAEFTFVLRPVKSICFSLRTIDSLIMDAYYYEPIEVYINSFDGKNYNNGLINSKQKLEHELLFMLRNFEDETGFRIENLKITSGDVVNQYLTKNVKVVIS